MINTDKIVKLLGNDASLLEHNCTTISKDDLHHPGSDFIDRVFTESNRNAQVQKSLAQLYGHGRLRNKGYLSILPVDQGIEHSAGASFAGASSFFSSGSEVSSVFTSSAGFSAAASSVGGCSSVAVTSSAGFSSSALAASSVAFASSAAFDDASYFALTLS